MPIQIENETFLISLRMKFCSSPSARACMSSHLPHYQDNDLLQCSLSLTLRRLHSARSSYNEGGVLAPHLGWDYPELLRPPHLSGSMSLVGNYQAHYRNTEASYSQHYYGNRYELPSVTPPSIDTSYLGWSFSTYNSETSQDFTAQVQAKDYCPGNGIRVERGFKRRVTANRKERRRTLSINNAFQELRECIPNVPSDTKLSKIKTLRLATSYIAYLMDLLAQEDPNRAPQGGFKAELCKKFESREERRKRKIVSYLVFI